MAITLKDYINKNMQEVLKKHAALQNNEIDTMFSFDGLEIKDDGEAVKVIYDAVGQPIELDDILHLTTNDFKCKYTFKSAQEALDKYLSAFKILSASELLIEYCQSISASKTKLDRLSKLDSFSIAGIQI